MLRRVVETCVSLQPEEVVVCEDAVHRFVAEHDAEMVRKAGSSLGEGLCNFPIDFTGREREEVSFIAVTHALDFGSGYRKALHSWHGKGAWGTIKDGVVRMHAECPTLASHWLVSLTVDDVQRLFSLPSDGDLKGLVDGLHMVCRELGNGLQAAGYTEMHQLLCPLESAEGTVATLVRTFPKTFDDSARYRADTVCFYKKAQLVTGELFHRFGGTPMCTFRDADLLTPYVDNVIVAMMRKTGCIVPIPRLCEAIEEGKLLASGSCEEVALRAKALHAVHSIAVAYGAASPKMCEIGNYLWGVLGKRDADHRNYQRHATMDTVFY